MIQRIKDLLFELKLKRNINEILIKYANWKTDSQVICYQLHIDYDKIIDYRLRVFKKKYSLAESEYLRNSLLEYYNNILTFIVYQRNNIFYDPEDHLKIL